MNKITYINVLSHYLFYKFSQLLDDHIIINIHINIHLNNKITIN